MAGSLRLYHLHGYLGFLTAAALTTTGFTDFTVTDPPGVVGCSDAPGASAAGGEGSRMIY